jgi:hypothetical protein
MGCGNAGFQYKTFSSMLKQILELDRLELVLDRFVSQAKMLLDVSAR